MTPKRTFIFSLFILFTGLLYAQDKDIRFLDDFRFHEQAVNPDAGVINSYKDIEGSPYLFPDFRTTDIYTKDGKHYRGKIRYDMYMDEMEFQINKQTFWVSSKENIAKIVLDGKTFLYLKNEGAKKGGYFELLVDGRCRLLVKYQVNFKKAEEAKPYQEPSPAHFEPKTNLYYLSKKGEPLFLIKNKKSLLKYLNDKNQDIPSFMRKNHISPSREGDLKKLISYYNSLTGSGK